MFVSSSLNISHHLIHSHLHSEVIYQEIKCHDGMEEVESYLMHKSLH